MASTTIKVATKFFIDRPHIARQLGKWKVGILGRTGAYGRGVMRKQIKPALKRRKSDRTVSVNGKEFHVPPKGHVIDIATGRRARIGEAEDARLAFGQRFRGQGAGKPPRRGPTDKLRKFMFFSVDPKTESVVIGPEPFAKQPAMVNTVSVPELLNKGGSEIVAGTLVKYEARPYVETVLDITRKRMGQFIERRPVKRNN